VVAAIDAMPDRRRAIVYLRHVEGWSAGEIAELLDVSPQTVYNDMHKGTNQLRDQFRDYPATEASPPLAARRLRRRVPVKTITAVALVTATLLLLVLRVGWWWVIPLGVAALVVLRLAGTAAWWLVPRSAMAWTPQDQVRRARRCRRSNRSAAAHGQRQRAPACRYDNMIRQVILSPGVLGPRSVPAVTDTTWTPLSRRTAGLPPAEPIETVHIGGDTGIVTFS
jgi:hypothetical protein